MNCRGWSIYRNIRDTKGAVLIFVLWAFLVLGILALGLAHRAVREFKMVSLSQDRAQAYFITWTAMQKIVEILKNDDPKIDSVQDEWNKGNVRGETGKGRWSVDIFYDEERYVDLNKAEEDVLRRIFGSEPILFDSLRDWLDRDSEPRPLGAEDDYYVRRGEYECRDGPMRSLFELGMMRGGEGMFDTGFQIDEHAKKAFAGSISERSDNYAQNIKGDFVHTLLANSGWEKLAFAHGGSHGFPPPPWDPGTPLPRPIPIPPGPPNEPPQGPPYDPPEPDPRGTGYTVYGDGRCNINTALPQVLMALGLQKETVKRIIWYRIYDNIFPYATPDTIVYGLVTAGCLKPLEPLFTSIVQNIQDVAGKGRLKPNSSYFRVRIISETFRGARHTAVAVIKRGKDKENKPIVDIISWWEYSWL